MSQTKFKEKRYNVIKHLMNVYGIEYDNKVFISIWDLAYNINNTWRAKYFVNTKRFESDFTHNFVLGRHLLYEMFPAIKHGIKDTDIKLRKSCKNKSEYLLLEAHHVPLPKMRKH